jgi:hypothetical protein
MGVDQGPRLRVAAKLIECVEKPSQNSQSDNQ